MPPALHFFTKIQRISLAAFFIAVAFCSCQKESEPPDPSIVFEEPYENQEFRFGDSLLVRASIHSADPLTALQVAIVDAQLSPVSLPIAISLVTPYPGTWKVQQHIYLDAKNLESGDYFVWIKAVTAGTSKNKYQKIRIIALESKIKNIFLLLKSQVNTTSLWALDTLMTLSFVADFPVDHGRSLVDSDQGVLYLAGRNVARLLAYDLEKKALLWEKQGAGTVELPCYQDISYQDGRLFCMLASGKAEAYNAKGDVLFFKDFGFTEYPVHCLLSGNQVFFSTSLKSGPAQYLNRYYYPSGAYQSGVQTPFHSLGLFRVGPEKLFVPGLLQGKGVLRYYYPDDLTLETAAVFPDAKINTLLSLDAGNYLLGTDQNVYWFQAGSNTLSVFVAGTKVISMDYNPLQKICLLASANQLGFYAFPNAGLMQQIPLPDSLRAVHLYFH